MSGRHRPRGGVVGRRTELRRLGVHVSRCAAVLLLAGACNCSRDPVSPDSAVDRVVWAAPLTGDARGEAAATTDAVYAATDSGLAAVDRASGALRWFTRVPGLSASKRVLVRSGRVLTAGSGSVRAHQASTGAPIWTRAFDVNVSSPDFSDLDADGTMLFVGLRDGRALALAQADGAVVWEAAIATPEWTFKGLLGGSTVSGDTVYVTATRYLTANAFEEAAVIVALDRATGRELWRYQSPGINTSIANAAVPAGPSLIFTEAYRGAVIAVNRATGVERWRQPTFGFFFGPPMVRGDTVYAATSASRAYAMDVATGRILWIAELEAGATSVGVCGAELFVGDFHVEVRAADDGRRIGLAFTGTNEEVVTSRIIVAGDMVYVGTNRRLMAFRCK